MANVYNFSSDKVDVFLILLDISGSMSGREDGVRKGLEMYKKSFEGFPEANSISVSISKFGDGFYPKDFEEIRNIDTSYYSRSESTALYYSIVKGAQYLKNYMDDVANSMGFFPKATFIVFSDGEPCQDTMTQEEAKKVIENLNYAGITTVFVAFGNAISSNFGKNLGFQATIDVKNESSVTEFLGKELSKSCKEQSKSLKALGANFFSKAAGEDSSNYSNTTTQALEDDTWLDDI